MNDLVTSYPHNNEGLSTKPAPRCIMHLTQFVHHDIAMHVQLDNSQTGACKFGVQQ